MVTILPFTARFSTYYCRFGSGSSSSTLRYHAATQAFSFIEKWMFNFLPCDYFRHIDSLAPAISPSLALNLSPLALARLILLMRFILLANDLSHLCLIKIGFNASFSLSCLSFFYVWHKFIVCDNGIAHIVDIVNTAFKVYGLLCSVRTVLEQKKEWKIASNTVILAHLTV